MDSLALEAFVGNWPSLGIMAIFLIINTLVSRGHLSKLFKGKGKTVVELMRRMEKIEGGFVPGLDEALARIDGKLDALTEGVCEMERRLNHVDKSALMGIIYNPAIHVVDRLRAFVCYLKLDGNGLVLEYAVTTLVAPHREDWIRAQQENRMKIYCEREKYEARIAEIDRRTKS